MPAPPRLQLLPAVALLLPCLAATAEAHGGGHGSGMRSLGRSAAASVTAPMLERTAPGATGSARADAIANTAATPLAGSTPASAATLPGASASGGGRAAATDNSAAAAASAAVPIPSAPADYADHRAGGAGNAGAGAARPVPHVGPIADPVRHGGRIFTKPRAVAGHVRLQPERNGAEHAGRRW